MTDSAGGVRGLSDIRLAAKKEMGALLARVVDGPDGDTSKCIVLDPTLINPLKYSSITTEAFSPEKNVKAIFPRQTITRPSSQ